MAGVDVLVVEDEAIVAKDIKRQLTRFGYGIAALASSGEEAVEKAAKLHPDLVLMDIRLKGELDGIQAIQEIRRQSDIPVVYLTAYADAQTAERAKATEPNGYLLKPFEGRELQMAIEIAVQRHRSGRVLSDSTTHKRAAEKLRKDRDRLHMLLRERRGKLSRANGHLKEALTRRDHLQRALHNRHIAMKEILQHIEHEKQEIRDQIVASVDQLVMPIVRRLKIKGTSFETGHLELLERSLNELTDPFGASMKRQLSMLSPREIEICNVLKSGLTSKEVGRLLNIAPSTVERHRNNIRRKIGIHHQNINITTYLQGL